MCMLAMALGLVALGSWGYLNPQNFILAHRFFDHVYSFGVVAALLAGVALASLTRRRWAQVSLVVAALLVACLWALFGFIVALLFGEGDVEATAAAPSSPYKAVVRLSYANAPDPSWIVSIQQTGSLTAREFEVGCINGDDPQYGFRRIRWADSEHLMVYVASHATTVRVDPTSGKPLPVSGEVWNC